MENTIRVTTRSLALVLSAVLLTACGGSAGQTNGTGSTPGSALAGAWTIALSYSSEDGIAQNTSFNVTMAPGACTITISGVGTYGEQDPSCYAATGSTTGYLLFPSPGEVLTETDQANPTTGNPMEFGVTFIEGNPESASVAVFSGTGTITVNGTMTGNWMCAFGSCTVGTLQGGFTSLGGSFTGEKTSSARSLFRD